MANTIANEFEYSLAKLKESEHTTDDLIKFASDIRDIACEIYEDELSIADYYIFEDGSCLCVTFPPNEWGEVFECHEDIMDENLKNRIVKC